MLQVTRILPLARKYQLIAALNTPTALSRFNNAISPHRDVMQKNIDFIETNLQ